MSEKTSRHEHYYHQAEDTPPAPEQWVIDRWAKAHADEGHAKGFTVHAPVWRETPEVEHSDGFWVIVSEARG